MRKNTARHWLHATLDLLPVILIPVFMIYSHRHDMSTDITVTQDVYKDFYQGVKNGKPLNNLDNIDVYNDNSEDFSFYLDDGLTLEVENADYFYVDYNTDLVINNNDIIYMSINLWAENSIYINMFPVDGQAEVSDVPNGVTFSYQSAYIYSPYDNHSILEFDCDSSNVITFKDYMLFNLTSIFGSGNEPTIDIFESYLTQDYYDFGSNEVKVGTIDVQAKNNDIMSVFMDSFNNSVNKYFNMGNVFGLGNVYQWFNVNVFGGNAPVVIYSVYNIVVYELVMDLLFLLYALFMWFIDMLKRLIEKPLDSIK